jgi:hypothetical protein
MVFDLVKEYGIGYDLVRHFADLVDFSLEMKAQLPWSITLLESIDDREELVDEILKQQSITSIESEVQAIHLLEKLRKYVRENNRFALLTRLVQAGYFARTQRQYGGENLIAIRTHAERFDLLPAWQPDSILASRLRDNLVFFGLVRRNVTGIKSRLFVSPSPAVFGEADVHFESDSRLTSHYCLETDKMWITFCSTEYSEPFHGTCRHMGDFSAFGLGTVHIKPNPSEARAETFAFASLSQNRTAEIVNTDNLIQVLTSSISEGELLRLFANSSPALLHAILEFANDRSLLNLLLQLTLWVIERPAVYSVFVFRNSQLSGEAQIFNFLVSLKATLVSAVGLAPVIEPGLLLPSWIIPYGDRKPLTDLALVFEHQMHIGVAEMSLFDPVVNKAHTVAQLFVSGDFKRGFALTRILHVDIEEVMIEACAEIAQRSEAELRRFMIGIIPKLELESANRLIEALSSFLRRSKDNQAFVQMLLSGMKDGRNAMQVMKWFGSNDNRAVFALMWGYRQEVEDLQKDGRKHKDEKSVRMATRWLRQNASFLAGKPPPA